ncbi:MAG: FxsA family protein [Magnetococcales bacterium]|nr:FxsA family protein [Magnetococcales bacterium]
MQRLGLAFLVFLPILEISLLIRTGRVIGAGNTLVLQLAAALWGIYLVRKAGPRTLRTWHRDIERGIPPGNALLDGLLHLLAGMLLIVPGFLTDGVAVLLVFPPTRFVLKRWLVWYTGVRIAQTGGAHAYAGGESPGPASHQTIDGEYRRNDP